MNNYAIYSLEFNNFDIYTVFYVFSLFDESFECKIEDRFVIKSEFIIDYYIVLLVNYYKDSKFISCLFLDEKSIFYKFNC